MEVRCSSCFICQNGAFFFFFFFNFSYNQPLIYYQHTINTINTSIYTNIPTMIRELLLPVLLVPFALCYEQFCRCQCAGAYEIKPLNCADCSKRACLEYGICKGSEPESVIAECFRACFRVFSRSASTHILTLLIERESLKDKLVVVSFLLLTTSLLVYSFRQTRQQ